jgi:hypothetical protein
MRLSVDNPKVEYQEAMREAPKDEGLKEGLTWGA